MSKLVQRIVALVVMLAVVMSATAYGASTFVVDYQELKSDAPVVMTVNGEEIHADEYASYMMSQIINISRCTLCTVSLRRIWHLHSAMPQRSPQSSRSL